MKLKVIVIAFVLVFFSCFGVWYYVFRYSKTHHRNVESEDAIAVTAAQIVKDYKKNESAANAIYLNKAVQIKGIVLKKDKDQAGNTTVTLKSGDPFANVFCTLKPGINLNQPDSIIVIKGICSGFLSDVVLNEAIVLNPR